MTKKKEQKTDKARVKSNLPLKEELVIAKGLGVALLKQNNELKQSLKNSNKFKEICSKEKEELRDKLAKGEAFKKRVEEVYEKKEKENLALKKSVRISKAYIRMLLQEDITEHRINIVYNIEG